MLDAKPVRTLTLEAGSTPGRPSFLSAASGLVRRADYLYAIGDDELHLAVFRFHVDTPGRLVRLFSDRELSEEPKQRKAAKPDLEALTVLPPCDGHPHGMLLALGSGSTPYRDRGVAHSLEADGALRGAPVLIDLKPLYETLRRRVAELNIEGVCVQGDALLLFQRGNGRDAENAVIRLPLREVVRSVASDRTLEPGEILDIRRYELGEAGGGVVYTFTDADALADGRVVFTAAAEDTDDPYRDGAVVGSAVGVLGVDGAVEQLVALSDRSLKVEGVDAVLSDGLVHLLLVSDADDPRVASPLLSATLPA